MPKLVFDNRIGVGTIVAITIAVASLIGGYAVYGKTTMENEEAIKELIPAVSLNTAHTLNTGVHMPFQEKVKAFVPRTEFDVVKDDIKDLKDGQAQIIKILLSQ
jgi:hypothetical protein